MSPTNKQRGLYEISMSHDTESYCRYSRVVQIFLCVKKVSEFYGFSCYVVVGKSTSNKQIKQCGIEMRPLRFFVSLAYEVESGSVGRNNYAHRYSDTWFMCSITFDGDQTFTDALADNASTLN